MATSLLLFPIQIFRLLSEVEKFRLSALLRQAADNKYLVLLLHIVIFQIGTYYYRVSYISYYIS